jgi:hypothetical protein
MLLGEKQYSLKKDKKKTIRSDSMLGTIEKLKEVCSFEKMKEFFRLS